MERVPQEESPFVNTKSNTFIRRSINDKVLAVSQLGKNPWKIIIILFHPVYSMRNKQKKKISSKFNLWQWAVWEALLFTALTWSLYYIETLLVERQEGNRKLSYPFLQRSWHNVLKNPQGTLLSRRLYAEMWSWELCTYFTLLTSTEVLTVTANFFSGAVSTAMWYKRFAALRRYHLEFFSSNSCSSRSSQW